MSRSEAVGERADRSLWRDGNFLTLWSGQALAQLGSQVAELAIPVLAVLLLGASELEVGFLNAAGVAAFLVVGLPAGAWIDRMRKRRVMIWADAVRAVALGVVPLLWLAGLLEMWHLYAVALVVGVATVFFDVSYQSIIPSLVRPGQIAEANGKLQATYELANIGGPAVGGWLVGLVAAPFAILATVGTYVASFVALLLTRDHEEPRAADDRGPILQEIAEGLRWVFGNRLLRRIVTTTAVFNLSSTLSFTLLPIFLLRELGLSKKASERALAQGVCGVRRDAEQRFLHGEPHRELDHARARRAAARVPEREGVLAQLRVARRRPVWRPHLRSPVVRQGPRGRQAQGRSRL